MCGIIGIATQFSNGFTWGESNTFQDLLFLDALRGMDSTGVCSVDNKFNVTCHKEASHALDFIGSNEFKEFKSNLTSRGLVAFGHNRAATKGSIIDENAHPFWIDDKIILVQNGTYKGDHKHHKNVDVDSEAVAHVIADEPDVEAALRKINASYALCWYNVEERSINLIRNDERPMWLLQLKNGSFMWASEANFLYMAANRNNLTWEEKVRELPAYTLLTLKLRKGGWDKSEKLLDCRFRYQSTNQVVPFEDNSNYNRYLANWPQYKPGTGFFDDDGEWHSYQQHQRNDHKAANDTKPASSVPKESPTNVSLSMADIIRVKRQDLVIPDRNEAMLVIDSVNHLGKHELHNVEIIDFDPANNHPDPKSWFVYGNILDPQGGLTTKAVVYWLEIDKDIKQMYEYTENPFFKCSFTTVRGELQDNKNCIVMVYASTRNQLKVIADAS